MANRFIRPVADWVVRNRADLARYGLPVMVFEAFNWTFDHFGFWGGIARWGMLEGVLRISATALVLNVIVFFAYDVMKIDWLQAKYLRDKADEDTKSEIERFLTAHRTPKHSVWERADAAWDFVKLTAIVDPVILAIHYRESYFEGISWRDWGILVAATASACIIWSFGWDALALTWHLGHLSLDWVIARLSLIH